MGGSQAGATDLRFSVALGGAAVIVGMDVDTEVGSGSCFDVGTAAAAGLDSGTCFDVGFDSTAWLEVGAATAGGATVGGAAVGEAAAGATDFAMGAVVFVADATAAGGAVGSG